MDFGDYLRKCREKIKRTQPDVAVQIEIEQSIYQNWRRVN